MSDVVWSIVVVAVLVLVAVVLIADALLEKTVWGRVAASLALAAGLALDAEIGQRWLPLALVVAAVGCSVASRTRGRITST